MRTGAQPIGQPLSNVDQRPRRGTASFALLAHISLRLILACLFIGDVVNSYHEEEVPAYKHELVSEGLRQAKGRSPRRDRKGKQSCFRNSWLLTTTFLTGYQACIRRIVNRHGCSRNICDIHSRSTSARCVLAISQFFEGHRIGIRKIRTTAAYLCLVRDQGSPWVRAVHLFCWR